MYVNTLGELRLLMASWDRLPDDFPIIATNNVADQALLFIHLRENADEEEEDFVPHVSVSLN